MPRRVKVLRIAGVIVFVVIGALTLRQTSPAAVAQVTAIDDCDAVIERNAERMIEEGRRI